MAKLSRELIYGVGINDADFTTRTLLSYKTWYKILCRCYREDELIRRPSYRGCEVGSEWKSFSNFHRWFSDNYRPGWHIDKDLLHPGNKIYSPDHCVCIPFELNTFVLANESRRGPHPIGACWIKKDKVFKSQIRTGGKEHKILGYFKDPMEAHLKWHEAKLQEAEKFRTLCEEIHPELFAGLIAKVNSMRVQP